MDGQPQHARLITILPLNAAEPNILPLRAGEKQGLDFGMSFAAVLLRRLILWPCDDSFLATPGALRVIFDLRDTAVS